jgi:YVTN family beta-propeller protein
LKRAAIFLFVCLAASATAVDYQITKKIPIPGTGSWDYLVVDEGGRRLYVSHGTQVDVLDVDSGAIVGKVGNTPGVHGIAIAPELGRGFVSDGQSSTVTIFDLKTLKTIAEVPVGKKPDAIIYDPATSRVFAFNGDGNSTSAIEAATGKVVGTVDLGGGPEYAVSDGSGYIYNNLEDESLVLKINARSLNGRTTLANSSLRFALEHSDGPPQSSFIHRLPKQAHGRYECRHRAGDRNTSHRRPRGCHRF